jgi:hypothetical protein
MMRKHKGDKTRSTFVRYKALFVADVLSGKPVGIPVRGSTRHGSTLAVMPKRCGSRPVEAHSINQSVGKGPQTRAPGRRREGEGERDECTSYLTCLKSGAAWCCRIMGRWSWRIRVVRERPRGGSKSETQQAKAGCRDDSLADKNARERPRRLEPKTERERERDCRTEGTLGECVWDQRRTAHGRSA